MAYVDKRLWDETIRPLINMQNSAIIGITTPRGTDNFVSLLINMVNDDGTPFFNVLQMTTVCDQCNKLPTMAERLNCKHMWIPTYKSMSRQMRSAKIAMATGSEQITLQEDCGISAEDERKHFKMDDLRVIFDRGDSNNVWVDDRYVPERIYVCCDPNAGGKSNTAIVSCYHAPSKNTPAEGSIVILGIDIKNTTQPGAKEELLERHIEAIRGMQRYCKVPIILIPERALDFPTSDPYRISQRMDSVVVFIQNPKDGKLGVVLDQRRKIAYINVTKLAMDYRRVQWAKAGELFTNSDEYCGFLRGKASMGRQSSEDVDLIHGALMNELHHFTYAPGDLSQTAKEKKVFTDDSAIAFMMAVYWSSVIEDRSNIIYQHYRNLVWVNRDRPKAALGYPRSSYLLPNPGVVGDGAKRLKTKSWDFR